MHSPGFDPNSELALSEGEDRGAAAIDELLENAGGAEAAPDRSLDQVREILFGAESRRTRAEREALAARVAEKFAALEASYERRFETLMRELEQRHERACALLDAESASRREAMQRQYDELIGRLHATADSLTQAKTSRVELADLLTEVADRLRAAMAA
jgi:predicted  nucleic acid-binding Zn-ribbon protein